MTDEELPESISMTNIALDLVQNRKWQIFPIHTPSKNGLCTCGKETCKDQGKHPRTENGFKDSSSSPEEIRQWWTRWNNANIGIPTGHPNYIVVLDVDPRHGGDISLAKLEAKHGKLPSTFTVNTGGGGAHYYFSRFTGPKIKSVANAFGDAYPGLDVKGEHGYVIGPGSLHLSGNRYAIINDADPVDMPEWLETLLISPPEKTCDKKIPSLAPSCIKKGKRNDDLHRLACSLASRGIGDSSVLAAIKEENRTKCAPPLDDNEVTTLVTSACTFVRQNPPASQITSFQGSGKPRVKLAVDYTDPPSAPAPTPETVKIAQEIYESGIFLEYCENTFGKVWYGDAHILLGILLTVANMLVVNAKDGIHLHITGPTQSGKSDSGKAALQFIHPANRLIKTFSPKYLYHAELHPCTIIFSDDTVLDPETAALYRNMLTSWHTGVFRGSVDNGAKKELYIPPRVSLVLTSIDSVVQESDDGQDESRFLTLEVRRSPEQMAAIRAFIQESLPDIRPDLEVVYVVWASISPRVVTIHKKIDQDIPIREFKRYLTLVQAHALLCNRTTTSEADFLAIDNFLSYSKPMINSSTPALTRKEAAVLRCLSVGKKKTVAEIVSDTKMTIQDVYRALHGRHGTFQNPKGGLMGKEPRLVYTRESNPGENDIHVFSLRE
jgi:hypothetical protein